MAKKAKAGLSTAPRDKPKNGLEFTKNQEINKRNVNKKVDTNHLIS